MSDTDVYRVMYKLTYGPDEWLQERYSRSNKSGLWPNLSSARKALAQLNGGGIRDRKIQKLERTYGTPMGDDTGLEWVDVDA